MPNPVIPEIAFPLQEESGHDIGGACARLTAISGGVFLSAAGDLIRGGSRVAQLSIRGNSSGKMRPDRT